MHYSILTRRGDFYFPQQFNRLELHAYAAVAAPTGSALTTDEAIACIRTAVAAQAGLVKGVEGEDKQGKRLCEVKIVDETGKRHKLQVDVQTNQVVKVK